MRLQLTILAALAASSLTAAETPKPQPKTPDPAPQIQTAKFWRLMATAQAARQRMLESEVGKAAVKAEEEMQAAQADLVKACGERFVLQYGAAGDLECQPKPEPPKAEPPKPAAEQPKGK